MYFNLPISVLLSIQVAVDVAPKEDEIGVGTVIFFAQGQYGGTEGSNEGGIRYHEGVITGINRMCDVNGAYSLLFYKKPVYKETRP